MWRPFLSRLAVLLLIGIAAARVNAHDSNLSGQSPSSPPTDNTTQTPTPQTGTNPEVTVTGKVPHADRSLPELPPDEFTDCMRDRGAQDLRTPGASVALAVCSAKLDWERHTVIDKCINQDGKSGPPVVIQACTESLDHKILQGSYRFYVFVNRAEAYIAQGDKERALADYNSAIELAPENAKLYYNRALFYAAQADGQAALRDFNTGLSINPKFVAALQQRAKIYLTQANFGGALADYSEAVRLQPKNCCPLERAGVCVPTST
jgi:tetratricopeptide (TPR) repeat protein